MHKIKLEFYASIYRIDPNISIKDIIECWIHEQTDVISEVIEPNSGEVIGSIDISHEDVTITVEEE